MRLASFLRSLWPPAPEPPSPRPLPLPSAVSNPAGYHPDLAARYAKSLDRLPYGGHGLEQESRSRRWLDRSEAVDVKAFGRYALTTWGGETLLREDFERDEDYRLALRMNADPKTLELWSPHDRGAGVIARSLDLQIGEFDNAGADRASLIIEMSPDALRDLRDWRPDRFLGGDNFDVDPPTFQGIPMYAAPGLGRFAVVKVRE